MGEDDENYCAAAQQWKNRGDFTGRAQSAAALPIRLQHPSHTAADGPSAPAGADLLTAAVVLLTPVGLSPSDWSHCQNVLLVVAVL